MNTEMNTIRLLGAAQVMVIVSFLITEQLQASAVGSGSKPDILVHISNRLTLMRISSLAALGQTLVIIAMGAMYYVVFYRDHKIIALVALGCFLLAAASTVVSKIGANALIPLSQEFVEAGAPQPSYLQTLGDFLYHGVDRRGIELYGTFMSLGFFACELSAVYIKVYSTPNIYFRPRSNLSAIGISGVSAL